MIRPGAQLDGVFSWFQRSEFTNATRLGSPIPREEITLSNVNEIRLKQVKLIGIQQEQSKRLAAVEAAYKAQNTELKAQNTELSKQLNEQAEIMKKQFEITKKLAKE